MASTSSSPSLAPGKLKSRNAYLKLLEMGTTGDKSDECVTTAGSRDKKRATKKEF